MRSLTLLLIAIGTSITYADEIKLIAKPDAFSTLVNPNCSHCVDEAKRRADELKADDPVLEWTRGYSDGGAIPIRFFLNRYRVISDSYGVFVYDPDAGYVRGFSPSYNFVFHGWRNGIMVMKDKSDGTLFSCLSGRAFEGPRTGQSLSTIPTLATNWGDVMKRNPNAVAYHMFEKYQPLELPKAENPDSVKSRVKADPRRVANDRVLGIRLGKQVRAYPIDLLAEVTRDELNGEPIVILKRGAAVSAYKPIARQPRKYNAPKPDANGVSPANPGTPLPDGKELESQIITDFELWDVAGRCNEGKLKRWTLEPVDAVVCKWFAWSAEYPDTELFSKETPDAKAAKATEMIAGTSEFLRILPKPFGVLKSIDVRNHSVSILFDGETTAKVWKLEPDAEIRFGGYWGRLEQFKPDQRVWTWLRLDRKKQPVTIAMLADEISEWDLHGSLSKKQTGTPKWTDDQLSSHLKTQKTWLRNLWMEQGLPGTLIFHHVFTGELELMLDHEAMRWGRSLVAGDAVTLMADPPIKGVVKSVTAWRERTQVRLVVGELESADLRNGQRLNIKMKPLSQELEDSPYPVDIDRKRTRAERIEWFLCNIYCVCAVGKDTCTGMFYTLASCNPNGCGAPAMTRERIAELIDTKKSDREIWDTLLKERGPYLKKPHLRP